MVAVVGAKLTDRIFVRASYQSHTRIRTKCFSVQVYTGDSEKYVPIPSLHSPAIFVEAPAPLFPTPLPLPTAKAGSAELIHHAAMLLLLLRSRCIRNPV